jgi:HEAT repeat protein
VRVFAHRFFNIANSTKRVDMSGYNFLKYFWAVALALTLICAASCKNRSNDNLNELIKELSSSDKSVRNSAALEIAGYGKSGSPAVPALVKLLNTDSSRGIRTSAAYALRSIGTADAIKALDNYKED